MTKEHRDTLINLANNQIHILQQLVTSLSLNNMMELHISGLDNDLRNALQENAVLNNRTVEDSATISIKDSQIAAAEKEIDGLRKLIDNQPVLPESNDFSFPHAPSFDAHEAPYDETN